MLVRPRRAAVPSAGQGEPGTSDPWRQLPRHQGAERSRPPLPPMGGHRRAYALTVPFIQYGIVKRPLCAVLPASLATGNAMTAGPSAGGELLTERHRDHHDIHYSQDAANAINDRPRIKLRLGC